MEAQKAIFLPIIQYIKELIEDSKIRKIKYIEVTASFSGRFSYEHWMYDLSMGGSALYGSTSYTIEYLQYLFDNPEFVINRSCIKCPTRSDEICNFQLKVNDSILISSTIAMNVTLINEAIFYGEKGRIRVPNYWKAKELFIEYESEKSSYYCIACDSEFVYEINHIHECIKKEYSESPIMIKKRTIETIALVEQLYNQWK